MPNLVYGRQSCPLDFPNCIELATRLTASPAVTYVNPGSFDLHLKLSSPAINASIMLSLVPTDMDGVPRPQGTSHDIGAYEYK